MFKLIREINILTSVYRGILSTPRAIIALHSMLRNAVYDGHAVGF